MRNLLTLKRARITPQIILKRYTSDEDDDEEDEADRSDPSSPNLAHKQIGDGSAAAEWIGITTNSEDCSYSSADNSESQLEYSENNSCEWNDHVMPAVILNSNCAIGDRSNYERQHFFENFCIPSSFFSFHSKLYNLGWTGSEKV